MTTVPITGPDAFAEALAQATTMADSEATIAFRQHIARIDREAEEHAAARQHAKSKYATREHINDLLDDSIFLGTGRYSGSGAGGRARPSGVVTGFGQIDSRQAAVYPQDFPVSGGALGTIERGRTVHLLDDALRLRIPAVGLINSDGAKIQEGVDALRQCGRIFDHACTASGLVPQINVILGPCADGAVYSPVLTDFVITTRRASHMFIAGPDVVRTTIGEQISAEDLGGAQIHGPVSEVVHYAADDEEDALGQVRTFLVYLPSSSKVSAPLYAYDDTGVQADTGAAHSAGEAIPASTRQTYDVIEVVSTIVDHGGLVQVQKEFAPNVVAGFACFEGRPVGIVTGQPLVGAGTLGIDASEKLTRFMRFCDAFGLPAVTFIDIPGYRPGAEQEHAGIICRDAKVINAYATVTVPLVTIVLRKACSDAYIVMGSEAIGADLNFRWSGAEIAVLGAAGAIGIIHRRDLAKVRDEQREEAATAGHERLVAEYTDVVINLDKAVAIGEIDTIITSENTRNVIVDSLAAPHVKNNARPGFPKKYDSIPL